jgi:hypothetical protein
MINFFQKLVVVCAKKRQYFRNFFGENIFKNHNIGPWKCGFVCRLQIRVVVFLSRNGIVQKICPKHQMQTCGHFRFYFFLQSHYLQLNVLF